MVPALQGRDSEIAFPFAGGDGMIMASNKGGEPTDMRLFLFHTINFQQDSVITARSRPYLWGDKSCCFFLEIEAMIQPIQTSYKGYLFRSRLEARWAVFFDELGVEYQYEPDGYEFDDKTRYLPDFYLPRVSTSASIFEGLWVEVKARYDFDPANIRKLKKLCNLTQQPGIIVSGDPMENVLLAEGQSDVADDGAAWWICGEARSYEASDPADYAILDGPYIFCVCPWCCKVGIEFDGRGARVCGYKKHFETEQEALDAIKHFGFYRADDKCYTGGHPMIVSAANAARRARFEHGGK
jgi:hypothetical protein